MVKFKQEAKNTDNATDPTSGGLGGMLSSAFSFFGKVLDNLKKDKRLTILWGFAVLQLVVLIVVLVLGELGTGAKLSVIIISMCIIVGLFIYTVPRLQSGVSGEKENDQGKILIERFYQLVKPKPNDAFKLIHTARIAAIKQSDPQFDEVRFAKMYDTTRQYKNFHIELIDQDKLGRNYRVEFDVEDEFPRNRLLDLTQKLFSDAFNKGIISSEQMADGIIENFKAYYTVPDNAIPRIREFINSRQYGTLFEPDFIYELKLNLEKGTHASLALKQNHPSTVRVWRHFIQTIQVIKENKTWKIGEGLERPSLIASYIGSNPP